MVEKWKYILGIYPKDIRLWKQYLDFKQQNVFSFNISSCIEDYQDCLSMLRQQLLSLSSCKLRWYTDRLYA